MNYMPFDRFTYIYIQSLICRGKKCLAVAKAVKNIGCAKQKLGGMIFAVGGHSPSAPQSRFQAGDMPWYFLLALLVLVVNKKNKTAKLTGTFSAGEGLAIY